MWCSRMKKYNLRCNYCATDNYVSKLFLLIRLIIQGKIYVRCPKCGHTSSYILISHIVHDTTDITEKVENKTLNENKHRLWRMS